MASRFWGTIFGSVVEQAGWSIVGKIAGSALVGAIVAFGEAEFHRPWPDIALAALAATAITFFCVRLYEGYHRKISWAVARYWNHLKWWGLILFTENFILNSGKRGDERIVGNFSIKGENRSKKFMKIEEVFVISNVTGERIDALIYAYPAYTPVSDLNDIPPKCELQGIVNFIDRTKQAKGEAYFEMGVEEFSKHWEDFYFVFSYSYKKLTFRSAPKSHTYKKRFGPEYVREQLREFKREPRPGPSRKVP